MRLIPKFHPNHQSLVWVIIGLFGALLLLGVLMALLGPNFLPLWYSLTVTEEQLAPRIFALSVPALGALITISSLWFGRHTQMEHETYIASISLWSGIGLLSLLLLAFLRIIKVVL